MVNNTVPPPDPIKCANCGNLINQWNNGLWLHSRQIGGDYRCSGNSNTIASPFPDGYIAVYDERIET